MVILLLLSCARNAPPPAAAEAPPLAVEVAVARDAAAGAWEVTYTLPEPAAGLWFTRTRTQFRAGVWSAEGAEIAAAGSFEYLAAEEDRRVFTVRFEDDTAVKPKDYELNLAFTDGGALLYAGHLAAAPMLRDGQDLQRAEPLPLRWTLAAAPGGAVMAGGRRGAALEAVEGIDDTYLYFGALEPVNGEREAALVDPGMPLWMVELTRAFIPEVFDRYAALTGAELGFVPTLFLSYQPGEEGVRSYGGGGLPGQIQLAASGQAWQEEDSELRYDWLWFLAHESFHMWNGQRFRARLDASEEWLSEGGASYMATRLLRDLGHIDQARFEAVVLEDARRCLTDLGEGPLVTAHTRGRYHSFYSCGSTLLFAMDGQLQAAGSDLPGAWAAVFEQGAALGDTWSTFALLEHLQAVTEDPLAAAPYERALRQGIGLEEVQALLALGGLPVTTAAPWEAGLSDEELRMALIKRLSACDCEGKLSADLFPEAFALRNTEHCRVLATGDLLVEVAGVAVSRPGEALEAMEATLEAVSIGRREGEPVTLSCPDAPPLAPALVPVAGGSTEE
jgi:hypothetical protein